MKDNRNKVAMVSIHKIAGYGKGYVWFLYFRDRGGILREHDNHTLTYVGARLAVWRKSRQLMKQKRDRLVYSWKEEE